MGAISPGSYHEPGLKLCGTLRVWRGSFSPGSCHEPGLMARTDSGPMALGALASRTGTNAPHWSRVESEPRLMTRTYEAVSTSGNEVIGPKVGQ